MIKVSQLSFKYARGKGVPLEDISFTIKDGEFILLTGRSGSGKTTLLRALCGLAPGFYEGTYSGSIVINDINVMNASPRKIASMVGYISQNPENQILALTVKEEIGFYLEAIGIRGEELERAIYEAADKVGILNILDRDTRSLSGGQMQLVTIAAALARGAKIMLLDEPLANIDPLTSARLLRILDDLNKHGITIILVEHRLDLIVENTNVDRVFILDRGHLIYDGPLTGLSQKELWKHVPPPTALKVSVLVGLKPVAKIDELVAQIRARMEGKLNEKRDN
ncbi:MAG: ABC transporter ATP-binding protein [Candidatus Korarchaeota archaeon]